MQNNGRLPDQVESNMRQLGALQAQMTFLDTQISRANQDKLQMESNVRIFKDQMVALTKENADPVVQAAKSSRVAEAEREVEHLESQLANLRQHYKDSYPDVQAATSRLAIAKKRRDVVVQEETAERKDDQPRPTNNLSAREVRELDGTIRRLQSAIEAKDLEVHNASKEMKRVTELITSYQARVENVPLGEKQYGELIRDRELFKQKYLDLSEKLQRAEIAQEMEGRKQGETLELLDPASLPSTPAEPKRPMVIAMGAGIGLMLGLLIAGAREMKDTSLKNLKDVRAYTQMAILGSVPLLENDFVVRRRRRLAWLGWTTASLVAAVVMSGSVVYYYVTRS